MQSEKLLDKTKGIIRPTLNLYNIANKLDEYIPSLSTSLDVMRPSLAHLHFYCAS